MKVAFDAQSLFEERKTGIGWTIEKLISCLEIPQSDKYQLNYFAFRNKELKRRQMQRYAEKGYVIKACNWFPLGIYRRIWNLLPIPYSVFMGRDTDITQFFNYVIPPGVKGKTVVYIYDMVYKAYPETMEETTRRYMEKNVEKSCKRADAIITISEFSKKEIIKYLGISANKIWVVPCGVDLLTYNPYISSKRVNAVKQKFGIGERYFLYLGTLEPRKNITIILKAYNALKLQVGKELPKLVLAGKKGWGYDEINHLVKSCGLEQDVIFTGYISEEEKAELLRGALVFLFPSLYEGFGMPPLEAMACGTPVIVSNAASLPEVVGDAGLTVDPYSTEELKNAMKEITENKKLREELGYKGYSRAQIFKWESIVKSLNIIYDELAK